MAGLLCAIHQPNFLPRLSTLAKLYAADIWIILDDVQSPAATTSPAATSHRLPAPRAADYPRPPARRPGNPDRGCSARRRQRAHHAHPAPATEVVWGNLPQQRHPGPRRRSERLADLTRAVGAATYLYGMPIVYQSRQIWPRQDPNGSLLPCGSRRGSPETWARGTSAGSSDQRLETAGLRPLDALGARPPPIAVTLAGPSERHAQQPGPSRPSRPRAHDHQRVCDLQGKQSVARGRGIHDFVPLERRGNDKR